MCNTGSTYIERLGRYEFEQGSLRRTAATEAEKLASGRVRPKTTGGHMLTLKAEADAGVSLRDDMIPQMIDLARRTGCRVEVKGNDTLFWASPEDTAAELQAAYDRLYPQSWIVGVRVAAPVPRPRKAQAD